MVPAVDGLRSRCAEEMKDWERAEGWQRRITERYDQTSWSDWYYFCKRTGHGDLKLAREFVDEFIRERANRPDLVGEEAAGCFYWVDGRTEQAKALLSKAHKDRNSFVAACCLAMIADDSKDASRRDELIKDLISKYKKTASQFTDVLQMLLDTVLDSGGKKPLDQAALNRLIDASGRSRDFVSFLAGWFLKNHGQPETAKNLLERCANSPNFWIGYRTLAADAIKRLKPE